jgi:hypothetical protein
MTPDHPNSGSLAFAMWLNGAALTDTDADGNALTDDTFLILFNASWNPHVFTLPPACLGTRWLPVLDSTQDTGSPAPSLTALPADSACVEPAQPAGAAQHTSVVVRCCRRQQHFDAVTDPCIERDRHTRLPSRVRTRGCLGRRRNLMSGPLSGPRSCSSDGD